MKRLDFINRINQQGFVIDLAIVVCVIITIVITGNALALFGLRMLARSIYNERDDDEAGEVRGCTSTHAGFVQE
jgi:hypothetical protein